MISTRDPRTGAIDGSVDETSHQQLTNEVARVREAQRRWSAHTAAARAEVLAALKGQLEAHRDKMIGALVADTGRTRESAMEFDATIGALDRWCRLGPQILADEPRFTSAVGFIDIARNHRPYEVVGIISPWNFPLVLSTIDLLPALMAGCGVVLKPSEVTPRFAAPLQASIDAVPELADLVRVVIGDGSLGAAMIALVDAICFTGSVPTGRNVAVLAAEEFIPAFLELGGKDPAIVVAGADLDLATSALLWGSTSNAGQACQSIERIYVQRSVHDEFVEMLVAKAARVGLCWPDPDSPGLGPIISERQVAVIEAHLSDAIFKGASVRCGSSSVEYHGGGAWVRPTVLTDVDHSMMIMTEETFGPFLPVMGFDCVDDAVALANDSRFGLSAAVFASTNDEAESIAARVDAGAVSVNDSTLTAFVWEGEKHSFKSSGLGGSRMGPASLLRFLRSQAFLVKTNTAPDPWWYPE